MLPTSRPDEVAVPHLAIAEAVEPHLDLMGLIEALDCPRRTLAPAVAKRVLDVVLVLAVLPLALPLLLVLALLVKLEDGGPVLFLQPRVGGRLHLFAIFKFRTMVVNAASVPVTVLDAETRTLRRPTINEDLRITRVGGFLRRWSLDELPQLFNILLGDMAIVGPRPLTLAESLLVSPKAMRRYAVPAGLTGLAQIRHREMVIDPRRFDADVEYVEHWTLSGDFIIMLRTFRAIRQK